MSQVNPITLTWLDVNSWLIAGDGFRILVDPWLMGDLVFGNAKWLIRGVRPQAIPIPVDIDMILLSQGLADHAHPETLRALDKRIPVVASPSGAKVASGLGFQSVTVLASGQQFEMPGLKIQALPGAPIGPLAKENAYVLTFSSAGHTLYYEPHGYPSAELQGFETIDVVITPVISLNLPLLGPVIRGGKGAFELVQQVKPQWLLPTAAGGEVTYTGLLASFLTESGGVEALRSQLSATGLKTAVKVLKPMEPFPLDLCPHV